MTRQPSLDGLRGLAVLLVMASHFLAGSLASIGWVGVDLFFVLSGYLITSLLRESRDLGRFYCRRAFRILPLYYLAVLVSVLASPTVQATQAWYWLHAANWLFALRPEAYVGGTFHFWSLGIEEQFYLLWPLVVWSAGRRLPWVCLALIIASFGLRALLALSGASWIPLYVLTPTHLEPLAIGSALAASATLRARLGRAMLPAALGVALCTAASGPSPSHPGALVPLLALTALGWGAALAAVLRLPVGHPATRILAHPVSRALGAYSYALYLVHPAVKAWLQGTMVQTWPAWSFLLVGCALSLAVAMVVHYAWERPWLRIRDAVTDGSTGTSAVGERRIGLAALPGAPAGGALLAPSSPGSPQ
jgi:peptidoglycan/LPS O-acetylase OafA/YrhL